MSMQETKQYRKASPRHTCANCKAEFTIEPEDFDFYDKMQVPAPTWCPQCRLVRRMLFRNERTLYRTTCQKCEAATLTIYHPDQDIVVYCVSCWWSDNWEAQEYGQEYDFSKPFFEQFKELYHKVPKQALWIQKDTVNSQYANYVYSAQNVYLSYSIIFGAEDVYYSQLVSRNAKNIFDSLLVRAGENVYENVESDKNFNSQFMLASRECIDSAFLYDSVNCSNCMLSTNLRNREYVFRNQQLSREEYLEEKAKLNLGSYKQVQELKKEFEQLRLQSLHRFAATSNAVNISGNVIQDSKNVHNAFSTRAAEDCKYLYRASFIKECYDTSYIGGKSVERFYEFISAGGNLGQFGKFITNGADNMARIEYIDNCQNISDCFGVIGAKAGQYLILNKQYTKEEYEDMIPKIKQHMHDMPYVDSHGRTFTYGEMFPPEISPFAYNESLVQEFFPLTKDEALAKGYRWRDEEDKQHVATTNASELPDDIRDVDDSILDAIIACEHAGICKHQCTKAFKLIKPELEMYRRVGLPIPRQCPNCRHYARVAQRQPLTLWNRQCMCDGVVHHNTAATHPSHLTGTRCINEFETPYSPERKEIIYCEQCYQAEVI